MTEFERTAPDKVFAEQYSKDRHIKGGYVPDGVRRNFITGEDGAQYEGIPSLETPDGDIAVHDGDWIVHYPEGISTRFSDEDFRREFKEVPSS